MRSLSFVPRLRRLKPTAVIYPGSFLVIFGEGMLNLGIVFFLRERYGASPGLIGGFMAYSVLVYILGCLLLRPLFERLRPQVSLSLAVAGMLVFVLLLVLLHSLLLSFLLSGLYRLSLAFFWPPAMGWLSQGVEGSKLNRRQSHFNLSWSTGLVASYSVAGIASQRAVSLPLLLAIMVFAAYALYLGSALAAVPGLRVDPHPKPIADSAGVAGRHNISADNSTPLRFPAWAGMFASYVVSGMLASVFPLFAMDVLEAGKSLVGTLFSSRTLAQSLGFLLLGSVGFWHYRGRYLVATQAYLAILLVLMSIARTVTFFAILFPLLGLAAAMSYAGSLFHGIAGASRRAERMAIHESVLNGGYIAGALASGLLYQLYSMQVVVLLCLGCNLLAILVQNVLLARIRRAARQPATNARGTAY
jgi:DHA1 family multidrug resistance protein-like MFS transporter/DHA1 family quinolone resistance protein-like MFS transporter